MSTINEKLKNIDIDKPAIYSWVLGNLLNESGYIKLVTPFAGGPYFFRKSDATFWELYEIQKNIDSKPKDSKPKESDSINKSRSNHTLTLCFKKIANTTTCEIMQNTFNTALGTFNDSNGNYGYSYGYASADKWTPAVSNDPRRIKYNDKAQTKAPFTMAIALQPEIMKGCLDKHKKIKKNIKSAVRLYRDKKASRAIEMLNLKPLDVLPIELARYSQKRKRRYYISTNGGGGPNGNKQLIWCINHIDLGYNPEIQVIKLGSYAELMDVCNVNNIKVPSRQIFKAQKNILYVE